MKFSDSALLEMLLSTGDVMGGGKICDDLLTDPTTLQESRLGVGEAPFEVWHNALVSGLLPKVIRVLEVEFLVGSTYTMSPMLMCVISKGENKGIGLYHHIPRIGPPFSPSSGCPSAKLPSRFWMSGVEGAAVTHWAPQ